MKNLKKLVLCSLVFAMLFPMGCSTINALKKAEEAKKEEEKKKEEKKALIEGPLKALTGKKK